MAAAVLTRSPLKDVGHRNAAVRSACRMVVGAVLQREEGRGIWLDASAQDLGSGQTAYALLMDARNCDSSGGVQQNEAYGLASIEEYAGKQCPRTGTSYLAEASDAAKRQQDGLAPTTLERVMKIAAYATAASTVVLYHLDLVFDFIVLHSTTASIFRIICKHLKM